MRVPVSDHSRLVSQMSWFLKVCAQLLLQVGTHTQLFLLPSLHGDFSSQNFLANSHIATDFDIKIFWVIPGYISGLLIENECFQDSDATVDDSQSIPSLIPFPSIHEQATIDQLRSRSSPSFNASEISPAPFAPG